MDAVRELLDLAVRWIHVVAGIMWIGNSLLFNWLDRNLRAAARPREGSQGEIWLLHSGGFYEVEKTLSPGPELPRPLHWFKWQAYTTWLSGAALLVLVYYTSGSALLVDPGTGVSAAGARVIAVSALLGGWIVYELLWGRALGRRPIAAALISVALLLAAGWGLGRLLSDRAAFVHVGALMATLMAGNVAFHIMPAQRQMVGAVARGEPVDARQSERAKLRSTHNNYLTFPVIILMMSSHFPGFYSHERSWLVLGVLILGGAAVRHILNIRFGWPRWLPALAVTAAATLAALYLVGALPRSRPGGPLDERATGEVVTFDDAQGVIRKRCTVCHSASPSDRTFGIAPGGVALDTPEQMRAFAARIRARAIDTHTMPPANRTWMTEQEREILARWLR